MFGLKMNLFRKRFLVTSVKKVKGNGKQVSKWVKSRSASGAAMKADPAGSGRIVKVTPFHIDEYDDRMVIHYAATDASNNTYTVTVEEYFSRRGGTDKEED